MATITQVKNKNGVVTGYRVRVCVGRDEHNKQVWRTKTIPSPGKTPAREKKEVSLEAEIWEKEQKAEYEVEKERIQKERKEKDKITLVDFIDKKWMIQHVQNGKHTPDTVGFYIYISGNIKHYFNSKFPKIRLNQVDKETILEYLNYLQNDALKENGEHYSAATIKHHFGVLRNILDFALYLDYVKDNPCKKIRKADRPQKEEKDVDYLEDDDAIRFIACLESEKEKEFWEKNHGSLLSWQCMVNTMILTGLRRGEMCGLRWKDLNKKNLVLNVKNNVTIDTTKKESKDPADKIHIGTTKGKRSRVVPITRYLLDLLEKLKKEQDAKYGTLMPSAYIFCRSDNPYLPIYPTEPTRMMRKYIKRHNLPDVSPHDLRHTAASLAIESGADVKQVQSLLGHKDPSLTLKFYTGITQKRHREATEGIESKLRPKETEQGKKAE